MMTPPLFRARLAAVVLALTAWTTACSDDGTEAGSTGETGDTDGELSHAADIQPIWDANCVTNCHEPGGVGFSLDLSGDAHGNIVGVASTQAPAMSFIEAGASDMSYIVAKLRGTQVDAGGNGSLMPSGADPLPEATIATIEAWIDAGAMP